MDRLSSVDEGAYRSGINGFLESFLTYEAACAPLAKRNLASIKAQNEQKVKALENLDGCFPAFATGTTLGFTELFRPLSDRADLLRRKHLRDVLSVSKVKENLRDSAFYHELFTYYALVERYLTLRKFEIEKDGPHANMLFVGEEKIITEVARGVAFQDTVKTLSAKYSPDAFATIALFHDGVGMVAFPNVATSPNGLFTDPISFVRDGYERAIIKTDGRTIFEPGFLVTRKKERESLGSLIMGYSLRFYHGNSRDPQKAFLSKSLAIPHSCDFFERIVSGDDVKMFLEGPSVFLRQNDERVNFVLAELIKTLSYDSGTTSIDSWNLEVKTLLQSFLTEDVEDEVPVAAEEPSPSKKKKKKGGKVFGRGFGGGRGKFSAAESDSDEEGPAGDGEGAPVTASTLDNDTMVLDSQETVTFGIEEDGAKTSAEGAIKVEEEESEGVEEAKGDDAPLLAPPSLARTASVKSDGGEMDRELKVKIMNLTQQLLSLTEGRKRFKVREYVSLIEDAFGLSGLRYSITCRGSHRTFHIDGIGAVEFHVPHKEKDVPADYLRDVAERFTDAAEFAEQQKTAAFAAHQKAVASQAKPKKKGKDGKK